MVKMINFVMGFLHQLKKKALNKSDLVGAEVAKPELEM